MNKKVLMWIFFLINVLNFTYIFSAPIELTICGQAINSHSQYYMSSDLIATGNCFSIPGGRTNVTIDMNNHRITGDGDPGDYGFTFGGSADGVKIINGEINNFDRGVVFNFPGVGHYLNYTLDNINFVNSGSYDIYHDTFEALGKIITISNSTFNAPLYLHYVTDFNLIDNTYNDEVTFSQIQDFYILDSSGVAEIPRITYTPLIDDTIDPTSSSIGIHNICSSSFSRMNDLTIVMLSDDSTTGDCFNIPTRVSNTIIDMNTHSITGDGDVGDYGFSIGGQGDVEIMDGTISSFDVGIRYSVGSMSNNLNFTFRDLEILDSTSYDIYYDAFAAMTRDVTIEGCRFTGIVSLNDISVLNFYLNDMMSADNLSRSGSIPITNQYKDISGELVGNLWRDFTCNDISNTRVIQYNGIDYTVCDENDYGPVNGYTDENPIAMYSVSASQAGSTSSSGGNLPFKSGASFLITTLLILYSLII